MNEAIITAILFLFSIALVIADACRYFSGPKTPKKPYYDK